jgi:hypothetical protein
VPRDDPGLLRLGIDAIPIYEFAGQGRYRSLLLPTYRVYTERGPLSRDPRVATYLYRGVRRYTRDLLYLY